ncbi:N-formylglutamate deformylase [Pantoea sp. A4]|uniref:N-formylglutamate deformylase n=1 Tax=Pantoea sp. A4 TaxID=1225184 RepID=UPI00035D4B63|nr:N-formylglutamate deformylase [Pantoea sp. A4]
MKPFYFKQGTQPLLVSIPHAGTQLTPEVERGLTAEAAVLPDTDWHLPLLYDFAEELGASLLVANYSRFVVDLNRPADDTPLYTTATTGLFPETLFDGRPVFHPGQAPDSATRQRYIEQIWQPYHQQIASELSRLKALHGQAFLYDAHSIASVIPRLFDGPLPDINIGTNDGRSCDPAISAAMCAVCGEQNAFSWVLNGRFKGGHITRHHGSPAQQQQAVQIELAQLNYMDETPPFTYRAERAAELKRVLKQLLQAMLAQA